MGIAFSRGIVLTGNGDLTAERLVLGLGASGDVSTSILLVERVGRFIVFEVWLLLWLLLSLSYLQLNSYSAKSRVDTTECDLSRDVIQVVGVCNKRINS